MSIGPVNNISFVFMGNFSRAHSKIISELLALGIQPSYNYAIDKAKLAAAKSQKIAKLNPKDKLNKEIKENIITKEDLPKEIDANINSKNKNMNLEFLGAMYILSINKAFIKKYK